MTRSDTSPVLLALLAGLASGCVSDIATAEAQSGVRVVTYRKAEQGFSSYRTFAVVGKLAPVTGQSASTGQFIEAPQVLASVVANLEARGFQQVATIDPASPASAPVAADLSVNATALEPTEQSAADFWVGSPEHLGPDTWGFAGLGWSYPWGWAPMAVKRGTLLVELADLSGSATPGALGVIWSFMAYDVADAFDGYDSAAALAAVDRAFAQSSYLTAAAPVAP